jgi:2-desacetyl-2-hydroxyethyl bacteriochlorophyllide A dehydrogenase
MKAIKVNSPMNLLICDVPMPENAGEHEVIIKVKMAGICGSDMHIYHGTSPVATYPRVIGHEIAGEVIRVGNKVSKVIPGDHVVVDPVISCGECYPCSIGRTNVCSSLKVRGVHVDGGYQEYMVLPEKSIYRISSELSWEEAVLIEPFTISAQIASRASITARDTVFIMGAGPAGLTSVQVVKKLGAKCIISDLVESRLELAKQMGADVTINASKQDVHSVIMSEANGLGITVVIDAVCNTKSFEQAVELSSNAGRIILLGFSDKPSQVAQLNITAKELDVKGSRLHANKFPEVIAWFENKELNPTKIISKIYNFTEIHEAIKQIEDNPIENIKVLLKFD